ncbi:MAG: dihydrolipoamide acetyltransferase family protein, partial [Anaerolineae bacterium]
VEEMPRQEAAAGVEPMQAPGGRVIASPRARRVAREKGVELAGVAGSGPNGRIVEQDVLDYLASQPAATPLARKTAEQLGVALEEVKPTGARIRAEDVRAAAAPAAPAPAAGELVPMKGVRAVIAERMARSHDETAPISLFAEADATAFVELREQLKDAFAEELGFNIGYNDLLAYIVARCLREYPYVNVRLEEGGIRYLPEVNIGMAVDSERGLLVPVLRNADQKTVKELAIEFRELVTRAREGRAQPDDLSGGTFTITNLGMFGIDFFTAMINLPEAAILSVGRIRQEPAVVEGEIAIRSRMGLGLTADHRIVDGAPAARFLQAIVRYVEKPYLLLA